MRSSAFVASRKATCYYSDHGRLVLGTLQNVTVEVNSYPMVLTTALPGQDAYPK